MRRGAGAALAGALLLSGCFRHPAPPAPVPAPHYFLGGAYEAGGHWFYPSDRLEVDRTGIAEIEPARAGLTADGERPDPTALTASMQTVPLPAIARVTDLDTGRQILVRVNDRGPSHPARLIAVSPRAAQLLGFGPDGVARVRVTLDPGLSREAVEQVGGGPRLEIATAPRASVLEQALPPPGQAAPAGAVRAVGASDAAPSLPALPERLPERVVFVGASPGAIFIDAGSFHRYDYAEVRASRLAGIGATVLRSLSGHEEKFAVRAGPFGSIAAADAALEKAFAQGIPDATLVIE